MFCFYLFFLRFKVFHGRQETEEATKANTLPSMAFCFLYFTMSCFYIIQQQRWGRS